MTRSLVCCCHLRFQEAIVYHPLGPCLFAILAVFSLWRIPALRGAAEPYILSIAPEGRTRITTIATAIASALLLAVWAARLGGWLPYPP